MTMQTHQSDHHITDEAGFDRVVSEMPATESRKLVQDLGALPLQAAQTAVAYDEHELPDPWYHTICWLDELSDREIKPDRGRTARLFRFVLAGGLHKLNLEGLLANSAREGVTLSPERLNDYALEPIAETAGFVDAWEGREVGGSIYKPYLDGPVGLMLLYKGRPQALAGLRTVEEDALKVVQIQGIRGIRASSARSSQPIRTSARGLAPLIWEHFLIRCTEDIARRTGFAENIIQGAANNPWTETVGSKAPRLKRDIALQHYDIPAHQLGYAKDPHGDWRKDIQ